MLIQYLYYLSTPLVLSTQSLTLRPAHFLHQTATHVARADGRGWSGRRCGGLESLYLLLEVLSAAVWWRRITLPILQSPFLGTIAVAANYKLTFF